MSGALEGVRGLLFDLDGTLIDSTADLAFSGNELRRSQGLPALEEAVVSGYIGDGIEALVRRLLSRPEGDVEAQVEHFRRHYGEHCLDRTRLYPGVKGTLEALRQKGLPLAVVTNKPERISRRILDGLGVGPCFGAVVGGNTCAHKKPHPEPLLHASAQLGLAPAHCAMVGDSRVDIEAARSAGMPSIAVLGGIGDVELLKKAGPGVTCAAFADLAALFNA